MLSFTSGDDVLLFFAGARNTKINSFDQSNSIQGGNISVLPCYRVPLSQYRFVNVARDNAVQILLTIGINSITICWLKFLLCNLNNKSANRLNFPRNTHPSNQHHSILHKKTKNSMPFSLKTFLLGEGLFGQITNRKEHVNEYADRL